MKRRGQTLVSMQNAIKKSCIAASFMNTEERKRGNVSGRAGKLQRERRKIP